MQATADGEFYPEKDLDKNYRIPKRPASQPGGKNLCNSGSSASNSQYNATQTPLANSYYNYPYDPSAASAYYQNYSQYYQQYGQAYNNSNNSSFTNQGYNANNQNRYNTASYASAHNNSNNPSFTNQEYNANNQNRNNTASNNTASSIPKSPYNSFKGFTRNSQYRNYKTYEDSARNFNNPPPPPPPPGSGMEPIKQNIYNTLKDIKEKPKNYNTNYFQNVVPDLQDESLPKSLKALFQPLYCKLCSAQLSSNQTAKMHYKSKNHEKKIRKWLIEYCEKTGEPVPKRAKVSIEKEDVEKNPAWYHCEVCDLDLTGKLHAESHYMGRSHQKAVMGWKAPAGQGYYDEKGKWVRTKAQKSKSFNFENGEDNFGAAFKPAQPEAAKEDGPPPPKKKKEPQTSQTFHCDVCDINTTCQEQLDNHYRGQKHMKKLKQLGLNKYGEQREIIEQTAFQSPTPSIAESSSTVAERGDLNLSVYRTPSGDYYCPTCNITSNSEVQFVQHMKSKNHAKKAAHKRSAPN